MLEESKAQQRSIFGANKWILVVEGLICLSNWHIQSKLKQTKAVYVSIKRIPVVIQSK